MFSLQGKRILITGASSGIGQATAVMCAKQGATVVLTGRNEQALNATASSFPSGTNSHVEILDLKQPERIADFVANVVEAYGRIDGLVHAAGIYRVIPISVADPDCYREAFELSVVAGMELARSLSLRKHRGATLSLVYLSSAITSKGVPAHGAYSASKGALLAAVRSMAAELAPRGIRANCVSPGVIADSGMYKAGGFDKEAVHRQHPLGLGKGDDVAAACVYLLCDAARQVTGANLFVDGGFSLT